MPPCRCPSLNSAGESSLAWWKALPLGGPFRVVLIGLGASGGQTLFRHQPGLGGQQHGAGVAPVLWGRGDGNRAVWDWTVVSLQDAYALRRLAQPDGRLEDRFSRRLHEDDAVPVVAVGAQVIGLAQALPQGGAYGAQEAIRHRPAVLEAQGVEIDHRQDDQ